MRLKFETLAYETNAIESVVDFFDGQPISSIWPIADIRCAVPWCSDRPGMPLMLLAESLFCGYCQSLRIVTLSPIA